jgi:hypothetical protein
MACVDGLNKYEKLWEVRRLHDAWWNCPVQIAKFKARRSIFDGLHNQRNVTPLTVLLLQVIP